MPVGMMKFGSPGDDSDPLETTSQRLEYFDAIRQISEQKEDWGRQCYERAREFPGLNLVWTEENFNRLQRAIDSGRRKLPKRPFDAWLVIDMRLGLSEEMKEHGWQEIANHFSSPWKRMTPRQAKYAYDTALTFLKSHLIKTLVPEKFLFADKSVA